MLKSVYVGCLLVIFLASCGGGGGGGNSAPALSATQSAFESFYLAPNRGDKMAWRLPVSGVPISGTHYLASTSAQLTASPLTNGTQTVTLAPYISLSNNLPIPSTALTPARYLMKGNIVVGSDPGINQFSYVGGNTQADTMSADGTIVVESLLRTNASSVPLSGAVMFNPSLLSSSAAWASGAAYLKFTQTTVCPGRICPIFFDSLYWLSRLLAA